MSTEHVMTLLHERNNAKEEAERDRIVYHSAVGFACYMSDDDMAALVVGEQCA